jgi:hypothetical protein
MFLLPVQNDVGIWKQIAILIFYQAISRLVILLKYIYFSVQLYNILVYTVCSKLINFVFSGILSLFLF